MSNTPLRHKLKMVILKGSAEIWSQCEDNGFKNLFYKMVQLKLRGYEAEYPKGVLPVDSTDFFADHILICEESQGELIPLSGIKSTTLKESRFRKVSFPGLSLVQAAQATPHIEAMEKLIEHCLDHDKNLAYTGSWTILPEVRKNRPLTQEITRHFHAAYIFHHLENEVDEIITGGTMRFKADQFFGKMGHDLFCFQDQPLKPIHVKHLFGEKVQILHLKKFRNEALEQAQLLKDCWDKRIEISAESIAGMRTLKRIS